MKTCVFIDWPIENVNWIGLSKFDSTIWFTFSNEIFHFSCCFIKHCSFSNENHHIFIISLSITFDLSFDRFEHHNWSHIHHFPTRLHGSPTVSPLSWLIWSIPIKSKPIIDDPTKNIHLINYQHQHDILTLFYSTALIVYWYIYTMV